MVNNKISVVVVPGFLFVMAGCSASKPDSVSTTESTASSPTDSTVDSPTGSTTDSPTGSTTDSATGSTTDSSTGYPNGKYWTDVAVSGNGACGLTNEGVVACWGDNRYGALDVPTDLCLEVEVARALTLEEEPVCWGSSCEGFDTPVGPFHGLSVNASSACALDLANRIVCWGPSLDESASPPSGEFMSVSVGDDRICALATDTTLACWGSDDESAAAAPTGPGYANVYCGDVSCCAVDLDGHASCWNGGETRAGPDFSGTFYQVASGGVGDIEYYSAEYPQVAAITADQEEVIWWAYDDPPVTLSAPEGKWAQVVASAHSWCGMTTTGVISNGAGDTDWCWSPPEPP